MPALPWLERAVALILVGVAVAFLMRKPDRSRTLITLGTAILALVARRGDVEAVLGRTLPQPVFAGALGLGCVLVGLGLAALAISLALPERLAARFAGSVDPERYECRPAKPSQLAALHTFATEFFGAEISTLDQMRRWHARNRRIFYLLFECRGDGKKRAEELCGYYSVMPLTEVGREGVVREALNGLSLAPAHIAQGGQGAAAVYIGAVAARGYAAKAAILAYLDGTLSRFRRRGVPVYTRPVTRDGRRLMKKYGFAPVGAGVVGIQLGRTYVLDDR